MAYIKGNKIAIYIGKSGDGGNARLDELDVKANGTYKASAYGCDGFNTVNVNVPNTCETVGLHVESNGTYKASDHGKDGFHTVVVDVPQTGGTGVEWVDVTIVRGSVNTQELFVHYTDGQGIYEESLYTDGEEVTVTVPQYTMVVVESVDVGIGAAGINVSSSERLVRILCDSTKTVTIDEI